ncbi:MULTISPECIES: AI-2E family transporter [unclassified Microbulbifer]|uniref:AI-2E family transporter n=1 Tax=Microbulbifer spongiae TaxID=2944933 RepID=A0ABY9EEY0_9GAMM|nr:MULTISPECIES: AI-2E family transporter [unclassified Microbulbifer]MDP5210841.1 AI-2E family transporter [Microbulbifer sp. 2205BS26-8]WKD50551.1 AI-2E family transporter [Microbulbifer sp. MI-G]
MFSIVKSWVNRYFSQEEVVLLVLLLAVALVVLATLGVVLAPVLTALVIAFLMQGMVQKLTSWRVPHWLAVTLSCVVLVGTIVALLFVVLPIIWRQLVRLGAELPNMVQRGQELLLLLPERYPRLISAAQIDEIFDILGSELGGIGQTLLAFSLTNLPIFAGLLIYVVVVPILVFFFLKDSDQLIRWCTSLLPKERPMLHQIWYEMNDQVANYVRGKVVEIGIVAVVSYVAFLFLGVNYALLLAVAVGFSVLIPYIGAAVVTIPVAAIGLFQWGWSNEFLYLILTYGIIQLLDGNVLVPLLFSEAVNLHPVAIILAVLFFGGIWGFWGVFFAIPLATLLKAIMSAWPTSEHQAEWEARKIPEQG